VAAVACDELSKKMSPDQIVDARRQAQEWVPQEKQADTVSWRLSIRQKEPEVLEKVRTQMGSNALISFREKGGWPVRCTHWKSVMPLSVPISGS
jgi:hypothetical protein